MQELYNCYSKHFIIILLLFGILNVYSQNQTKPYPHADFILLETGLFGSVGSVHAGITSTYGMGIYNYFHIQNFTGNRNSTIGIAFPMRVFISEPGVMPENITTMVSFAPLFRAQIQLHPEKDKWWMVMGVGPEYRWLDRADNKSIFMIQLEGTLARFSETSIFKNFELGTTSSFPLSKN